MGSSTSIPIAVDVCGTDSGLGTIVEGAALACVDEGISCILVGNESETIAALKKIGADTNPNLSVVHAPEEVTMKDSPSVVLRTKKNSSMMLAFQLVSEGRAAAVVSAGNTGAMMAAGLASFGAFPGIERPAIASALPTRDLSRQIVLLDSGANVQCDANQLTQFAIMGSSFVRIQKERERPRVGILSNGSELSKGTAVLREVAERLLSVDGMEFLGFVEGGDLSSGEIDVVVCDGLVGNIVLKTVEGAARMVAEDCLSFVQTRQENLTSKLSGYLRDRYDAASYGGAPLLGLRGIAMVCHGASTSRAICRATQLAWNLKMSEFVPLLADELSSLAFTSCSESTAIG